MTTFVSTAAARGVSWSGVLTAAALRTWCARVKTALTSAGLVQTSDTGQLDPATVALPATNADAGYLIYRFNDSTQGTDPIFLKVMPGRGNASSETRIRFQVGQGSNGSGTLTGTVSAIATAGGSYFSSSSINPATTDFACHQDGYFCLVMEAIPSASNYPPRHFFAISRMRDTPSSAFNGKGFTAIYTATNPLANAANTLTHLWSVGSEANGGGGTSQFCLGVGAEGQFLPATDYIAWPHFYWDSGVIRKQWAWFTTAAASLSYGANTFDASPYGTTRRWLGIGDQNGRAIVGLNVYTAAWALVLLWEA